VHEEEFAHSREAVAAYERLEEQYRDNDSVEIVLVGADSRVTVMLTNGNLHRQSVSLPVPRRRLNKAEPERHRRRREPPPELRVAFRGVTLPR
jgi:hypothetical protein